MANQRPVNVALLGAGTVGAEVGRVLLQKREAYARQLGRPLNLVGVLVRDKTRPRGGIDASLLTTDATSLLDNPDVDVIVELLGVEQPAVDWMSQALRNGKYVVTANKEVMAKHGPGLLSLARAAAASICSTRPASAAASRSSPPSSATSSPTASAPSPRSSTARPTTSSPR